MSSYKVRTAVQDDLSDISRIERQAAQAFRNIGYPQLADGAATPMDWFEEGLDKGFLWVCVDKSNIPLGFALANLMDGLFYLEDISVDPKYQRLGIGDTMLRQVIDHAKFLYCSSVVLSTLISAPWTEPFYRKHGFLEADMERLPAPVLEKFTAETEFGLPANDQMVMVKTL
ncbi:MAG: GNAT family N-acetyltransferase [Hyphomicrobiales bacterium]